MSVVPVVAVPRVPGTAALARIIAVHQSRDVLRKRWVIAYAVVLAVAGDLLLRLAGDGPSALVSLLNVVLLLVPLIALILGSASLYGAREFTELLLAQPIPRRSLYVGLYLGLTVPLMGATAAGLALPFLVERALDPATLPVLVLLLAVSVLLVGVFTALAFVITVLVRDRARGLGVAILAWLGLGVLYDGLILMIATAFRDWPIERGMLAAMALNPIDLARTILLLRLDVAALMGYTGAVFRAAFGSTAGVGIALAALGAWIVVPWWLGARAFERRDF
ncbi:MAG: ABC transporter permease subunit [Gemmatimonadaceae bacterium]|nr:ABC transporter permease subunit [Gemmatimonadaceae bacterium]